MKLQNFTSCYLKGATLYLLFSLSVMVTCRCYILRCYSRCYTGFCQDSSRLGKQLSPPHQRRDQLPTSDLEDNVLCPDSLLKRYPLTITQPAVPFFIQLSSPPLFLSRLPHTYLTLYLLFTITMLLYDLVRSKAESKLSFQEKQILSKILFKKNSTAETRDNSELERALRI